MGHLAYVLTSLSTNIRYLVGDGFYSKYKWVEGVVQLGLHYVGKLRCDANLKWLYSGIQKPRGRKRLYGEKVKLSAPEGFEWVEQRDDGTQLYTAIVWSVSLKRKIRVLYLCKEENGRFSYAVLFSTDTNLPPADIYRFYKARFQIEFVFRDARQFTGLQNCQARSAQAIDSHINASLTALNLANEHLLELFICYLDLDPTLIKSHPLYPELLEYGSLAA